LSLSEHPISTRGQVSTLNQPKSLLNVIHRIFNFPILPREQPNPPRSLTKSRIAHFKLSPISLNLAPLGWLPKWKLNFFAKSASSPTRRATPAIIASSPGPLPLKGLATQGPGLFVALLVLGLQQ